MCMCGTFQAADYIAATAARHSLLTSFPIHQVRGVTALEPPETTTNMKYVFIGAVLVFLACLLIGVLVAAQRKRAQGITWFPEGFFRNNRLVCVFSTCFMCKQVYEFAL
jgi:Notch-like protein